jgi:hypothetical protein
MQYYTNEDFKRRLFYIFSKVVNNDFHSLHTVLFFHMFPLLYFYSFLYLSLITFGIASNISLYEPVSSLYKYDFN